MSDVQPEIRTNYAYPKHIHIGNGLYYIVHNENEEAHLYAVLGMHEICDSGYIADE
jgi:hypothetical protein